MNDSPQLPEEGTKSGPNWILLILPVTLFVVLVAFFIRGLELNPRYVPSPLIGKAAPALSRAQLLPCCIQGARAAVEASKAIAIAAGIK